MVEEENRRKGGARILRNRQGLGNDVERNIVSSELEKETGKQK